MASKVYVNVFQGLSNGYVSYHRQTSPRKLGEKCALRSLQHIQQTLPQTKLNKASCQQLLSDVTEIHDNYMNSMCYICQLIDWIWASVWQKTDRAQVEELYQALRSNINNLIASDRPVAPSSSHRSSRYSPPITISDPLPSRPLSAEELRLIGAQQEQRIDELAGIVRIMNATAKEPQKKPSVK